MIKKLKNFCTIIITSNLKRRSAFLLSTFDKTVKGLQRVSIDAQKLASIKEEQINSEKLSSEKAIKKAKRIELVAIKKAEAKSFNRIVKTQATVAKVTLVKNAQIDILTAAAEKNLRIANKLQNLIS